MIVNHFIVAIASLASLATASSVKSCSGAILCIDYINDCGDKYGENILVNILNRCYDICSPQDKPTAPPCTLTNTTAPAAYATSSLNKIDKTGIYA